MERQLRVRISETGHGLHLRAGEPYIYEEPEMRILDEPSTFLRRHYVESGKRKSAETWRAAAYQLKFWLEFLVAQDIPWDIASVDDLKGYRDALHVAVSPHSKGDYDSKTIRNYMLTVISFYRFAAEQGWYVGTLSQTEQATRQFTSIDRDALAHIRKGAPLVTRSALQDLVPSGDRNHNVLRPFSVREWRALIEVLGPCPTECNAEARSSRDRLICEVAFWTGLRLSEVHGLTVHQFKNLVKGASRAAYSKLQVWKRSAKGGVQRVIRIPNWLVEEVQAYIEGERAKDLELRDEAFAARKLKTPPPPVALFVTGRDSNHVGRPLGKRRFQQILSNACIAAGLIRIEQRIYPESGTSREVEVAAHSFHDLRHSYAVWTYWAEKRKGNPEPWKLIQAQLGHKSLTITVDTYLHYVEIFDGSEVGIDIRELLGL